MEAINGPDEELQAIRHALSDSGKQYNLPGPVYRGGDAVMVKGTAYHLVKLQEGGPPLINLDIPLLEPGEAYRLRERIIQEVKDFIPVCETALDAIMLPEARKRRMSRKNMGPVELVHRQGMECVFTWAGNHYLSGFDDQEDPPLYFLCQLPHPVETVEEGRWSLMPDSVRLAVEADLVVARQGDLFVIETEFNDAQLREMGAKIFPTEVGERVRLYGTSHTADRVAVLPNRVMLASGVMRHDPKLIYEDRPPDHADLVLEDSWWWVARNTVPVDGERIEKQASPHRWNMGWLYAPVSWGVS